MIDLAQLLKTRILFFDGAMGTMLQRHKFSEEDFRSERFHDWAHPLKGNNDLLSLTQPDAVRAVHTAYLQAGANVISTNTFSSTRIAQADYGMEDLAYEMNVEGAARAREAIDAYLITHPDHVAVVGGAIGPTNRTLSLSPDVNDPGFRAVTFDDVKDGYKEAARGLLDGGADLIMIETIFDTLNAKAAIVACKELFREIGREVPLIISGTITDRSGRTLSGQTPTAFWYSVRHARPLAVGLNCALGAKDMRAHLKELSDVADTYISAYPNAGLPNAFGEYDESPERMAADIRGFAEDGLINIVGGCCGSTPEHIAAMVDAVRDLPPRIVPFIESEVAS